MWRGERGKRTLCPQKVVQAFAAFGGISDRDFRGRKVEVEEGWDLEKSVLCWESHHF